MNKRVILVGPACAGKDWLKSKLELRGFKLDVLYTTRPIREGETDGETYHYLSIEEFLKKERRGEFYEFQQHGKYWYGTGQKEWEECDVFIMETEGVKNINNEDRKTCFIIYLNPPEETRIGRMIYHRKWTQKEIKDRLKEDNKKFKNFTDYDIKITNPDF